MTRFDQARYWNDRVSGVSGLTAVGHRSLGAAYNHWIYRRRLEALTAQLLLLASGPPVDSVLDLGCGSGFYEYFWRKHGVNKLVGVDISQQNIEHLRLQFPEFKFFVDDLASPSVSKLGEFEIVTLFDVLYHVVENQSALQILKFASENLSKSGRLILFDQLLSRDYQLRQHVLFRSRQTLQALLLQSGLEIESETPLFNTLEPPLFGNRVVDIPIAASYFAVGLGFRALPWLGDFAGRLAYRFDSWTLKHSACLPNHAMFVIRRTEQH